MTDIVLHEEEEYLFEVIGKKYVALAFMLQLLTCFIAAQFT